MRSATQLITYADRLGGSIAALRELINGPLAGLFSGVHLLPFFTPIDGADAGFDPTDHTQVDPRLGSWADVAELARQVEVTADLIVNHISAASPQFQDFVTHGDASDYAGMFLTLDRVFPQGASAESLSGIYRPRPGAPFTSVKLRDGTERTMWTTFTSAQIDVDVKDAATASYFHEILGRFAATGVTTVRLDAVGYAVKTADTSCFMTRETLAFIDELAGWCRALDLEVLVEVHAHHGVQMAIADRVDWVYDFALPPLALHALTTGDGVPLKKWLAMRPHNSVTVLDTHDGIGVIDVGPDGRREGLLSPTQIDHLVEGIHVRSGGASLAATGSGASNVDLYQVNCTYYDALGGNDEWYLLARALQLFVPGVPQIYYVGLLAGSNDVGLVAETGNGRDINRHYFTPEEVVAALHRPMVRRLMELIRFRNTHPAFGGRWVLHDTADHVIAMSWSYGVHQADLTLDLADGSFELRQTDTAKSSGIAGSDELGAGAG